MNGFGTAAAMHGETVIGHVRQMAITMFLVAGSLKGMDGIGEKDTGEDD